MWPNSLVLKAVVLLLITVACTPADNGEGGRNTVKSFTEGDKIRVRYSFASPRITSGTTPGYSLVTIPGLENQGVPGEPVLPIRRIAIAIPAGKGVADVQVMTGPKQVVGTARVQPGVPPARISAGGSPPPTRPNERIYGSDDPFPPNPMVKHSVQAKSGLSLLQGLLGPVEYIPKSGIVSTYAYIDVIILLSDRQEPVALTEQEKEVLRRTVDNPEALNTYRP